MQSQPLNPDHLAALLKYARANKFRVLTRICLAAQRGDEAAEAAVAESIEDMREDDENAGLFH